MLDLSSQMIAILASTKHLHLSSSGKEIRLIQVKDGADPSKHPYPPRNNQRTADRFNPNMLAHVKAKNLQGLSLKTPNSQHAELTQNSMRPASGQKKRHQHRLRVDNPRLLKQQLCQRYLQRVPTAYAISVL